MIAANTDRQTLLGNKVPNSHEFELRPEWQEVILLGLEGGPSRNWQQQIPIPKGRNKIGKFSSKKNTNVTSFRSEGLVVCRQREKGRVQSLTLLSSDLAPADFSNIHPATLLLASCICLSSLLMPLKQKCEMPQNSRILPLHCQSCHVLSHFLHLCPQTLNPMNVSPISILFLELEHDPCLWDLSHFLRQLHLTKKEAFSFLSYLAFETLTLVGSLWITKNCSKHFTFLKIFNLLDITKHSM